MQSPLFVPNGIYEEMYSELSEAVDSLHTRRTIGIDIDVQKEAGIPDDLYRFFGRPRLLIFRQLASPINEILHAINIAHQVGLEPLILEYTADKFISNGNQYKRGLGKLPVFLQKDRNGANVYRYHNVVDPTRFDGKAISEVCTLTGASLVELHHELFRTVTGYTIEEHTIDGSRWFIESCGTPDCYYERLMYLLLKDAILMEILIVNEQEEQFVHDNIYPAFKKVQKITGRKPLIVRTASKELERDFFWDCYPQEVAEHLRAKGYS